MACLALKTVFTEKAAEGDSAGRYLSNVPIPRSVNLPDRGGPGHSRNFLYTLRASDNQLGSVAVSNMQRVSDRGVVVKSGSCSITVWEILCIKQFTEAGALCMGHYNTG